MSPSCPLVADGEREAELEARAADADGEGPAAVRQPAQGEGRLAEPHLHLPPAGHTVAAHVTVTPRNLLVGNLFFRNAGHLFYFFIRLNMIYCILADVYSKCWWFVTSRLVL